MVPDDDGLTVWLVYCVCGINGAHTHTLYDENWSIGVADIGWGDNSLRQSYQ